MPSQQPIGIFDSGVGGLSVAGLVMTQLPEESLLYYADTAHVPYGGRPLEEIRSFALSICDYLVAEGSKAIVMACNISSAVALGPARERHSNIPMLGVIEPGAGAALDTGAHRIGVLATLGTVKSGAYTRTIAAQSEATVVEVACPRFVPLVEAGQTETPEALAAAKEYLAPLAQARCEAIILGCTHYPFLLPSLQLAAAALFPPNQRPIFVDPAVETTRELGCRLVKLGLAAPAGTSARHRYCASGNVPAFEEQGSLFLGRPIAHAQHVTLL